MAMQEGPHFREAVVEAADHVEDESAVGDDFAEGPKIVGHLLEAATVLGDGEVALDEVAKPRLQLARASLFPRNGDSTASQASLAVEP